MSKLGRSMNDLLEENDQNVENNESVSELKISDIIMNPSQPRTYFDDDSLKELSESIKRYGVIQPIVVKKTHSGYVLVSGERRLRASKIAGLDTITAIVRDYNSKLFAEIALLENVQREDLTPIEESIAYHKIINQLNLTHEELSKRIGKSRAYITNILGLLNLPGEVITDVNNGKLSMGHARSLSKLKDISLVLSLRDRIINEKLSVRQLESIIRDIKKTSTLTHMQKSNYKSILTSVLGDKYSVTIHDHSITINFKNKELLEKLIERMKNE
jgi:ParB family chromosome partitioning protein